MKKLIIIVFVMVQSVVLFAESFGKNTNTIENKGNAVDGYVCWVSSVGVKCQTDSTFYSTGTIVSTIRPYQKQLTDVIIKNDGTSNLNPVWLDNSSTISTSGGTQGYKLNNGESISFGGKIKTNIYGRTQSGLSGAATLYIFLTGNQ